MQLEFIYHQQDGSIGFKESVVDPERLFARGVPAKMMVFLIKESFKGRSVFTIRAFRLDPQFAISPGEHRISSRVQVLIDRIKEFSLPISVERAARGEFSLLVPSEVKITLLER